MHEVIVYKSPMDAMIWHNLMQLSFTELCGIAYFMGFTIAAFLWVYPQLCKWFLPSKVSPFAEIFVWTVSILSVFVGTHFMLKLTHWFLGLNIL